jgi:hypothetical protein
VRRGRRVEEKDEGGRMKAEKREEKAETLPQKMQSYADKGISHFILHPSAFILSFVSLWFNFSISSPGQGPGTRDKFPNCESVSGFVRPNV